MAFELPKSYAKRRQKSDKLTTQAVVFSGDQFTHALCVGMEQLEVQPFSLQSSEPGTWSVPISALYRSERVENVSTHPSASSTFRALPI